jgi:hypothetical protein
MVSGLEKATQEHVKPKEEEEAREYLRNVYLGKVILNEPHLNHAINHAVRGFIRDAHGHGTIRRRRELSYALAICKFWNYPVSPELFEDAFCRFYKQHEHEFSQGIVQKTVESVLLTG